MSERKDEEGTRGNGEELESLLNYDDTDHNSNNNIGSSNDSNSNNNNDNNHKLDNDNNNNNNHNHIDNNNNNNNHNHIDNNNNNNNNNNGIIQNHFYLKWDPHLFSASSF